MKMEQTLYSEMLAYKIQTPGNYPNERIQHSERSGSLKSRIVIVIVIVIIIIIIIIIIIVVLLTLLYAIQHLALWILH